MAYPPLTPEAVRVVLTKAGLPAAEMGEDHRPKTVGFNAYTIPCAGIEDRIAVDWHFLTYDPAAEWEKVEEIVRVLRKARYKAEEMREAGGSQCAIVWTRGDY